MTKQINLTNQQKDMIMNLMIAAYENDGNIFNNANDFLQWTTTNAGRAAYIAAATKIVTATRNKGVIINFV